VSYLIAAGYSAGDLVRRVHDLMESGWKPEGGIAILPAPDIDGNMFFQVMVKK
jgi:hypothetical protein